MAHGLLCPRRMTLRSRPTHLAPGIALLLSLPLLSACEPPADTETIRGQLAGYPNPGGAHAGVKVMIPGHAPVTPDDSGAFEIRDVKVPYDVVLYYPSMTERGLALIFQGLERNDPTFPVGSASVSGRTPVSGTFSGPSFPLPAGRKLAVFFESPFTTYTPNAFTQSSYSYEAAWYGPETVTGTFHALEMDGDPSTGKLTYRAHGRREAVTLTQGVPLTGQDIALSPIATGSVAGRVVGTPGLTLQKTSVSLELMNERGPELLAYSPTTSDFQMTVPALTGATFTVRASFKGATTDDTVQVWKTGVPAGTTDLVLTSPAPVRLLTPESGAQLAEPSARFSWEGPPRAIYSFTLLSAITTDPAYVVYTTASSTTLPDLSPLGITGPRRGEKYYWIFTSGGPYDSVDNFLRSTPPPSDSRFSSSSLMRNFTLTP